MSAYSGDAYSYHFYYNFGSTYGATNDDMSFAIAPDEWSNDLFKDGLGPASGFISALSQDASDGVTFAKYLAWYSWSDSYGTYYRWDSSFWTMHEAGINPFPYVEDFTIVLQCSFTSMSYESWSEQDIITGVYYIVNGNAVGAVSV